MVIYIDEDRAYYHWITHHRQGFVLAGRYRPNWSQLVLHRATCFDVKSAKARRTNWTTGSRFKACALQRETLLQWVEADIRRTCRNCPECKPDLDGETAKRDRAPLTRLSADILEYILEAAVIHFDEETPPYHLTVAMIATCMGKSAAQVSPAPRRLLSDVYVEFDGRIPVGKAFRPRSVVYPTVLALQTLPEFAGQTDAQLAAELAKLRSG